MREFGLLSSLIPHPSSLIPHPSSLIPHPSSLIPHPSSLIPHPSSLIPHPSSILDAPVLLAACGRDPTLFGKMCHTLTVRVPEHLAALRDALRDQDAPRLREAAHKCCGMLSEFSTVAGDLAGSLPGQFVDATCSPPYC